MRRVNRDKGILVINIPTVLVNVLRTLGLTSTYDKSFFIFQLLDNIPEKEVDFDDVVCKAIESLGLEIDTANETILCYRIADTVWRNIITKFKQLTQHLKNPVITSVEVNGKIAKITYVWDHSS